ncbi:Cystatin-C [Manis javanica]|nr:Cystatin-C [Manis javanica]
MALRAPLLLLAALALALAVSPAAGSKLGRSQLVGGLMDADVREAGVQQALNYALSEYNQASNDAYHSRVLRVLRARKQVVAGMNYFLDVEIGRTTCTKSQPNLTSCPFHEPPHLSKMLCTFEIYTVPWKNTNSLTKSNCHSA